MKRRNLIGMSLALTGLSACTAAGSRNEAPRPSASGGVLPDLVGLKLRVARPGDMMTMDYNPERLTIVVDAEDRIESARIG